MPKAAAKAAPVVSARKAGNRKLSGAAIVVPAVSSFRRETLSWQAVVGMALLAVLIGALLAAHLAQPSSNQFETLYRFAREEPLGTLSGEAALRLPALAALLQPLGALPYPAAALLWLTFSFWAAVTFVGLWRPSPATTNLLAVTLSLPLFAALRDGRETPFLLAAAALSVWAVRRNRDFLGGLFLSLGLLVPQLFFLIPLLPLAQRRLRLGLGLLSGACSIVAASYLAAPPDWPLDTLGAMLQRSDAVTAWNEPTLRAVTSSIAASGHWALAAGCVVAASVVVIAARVSFPLALAAAMAGGLLTSPFAELSDALVLLPVGVSALALAHSGMLRAAALSLLCPLLYLGGSPYTPPAVVLATAAILGLVTFEALARPQPDGIST